MYTISIIVPIYNAEESLRRCIDSILQQTFRDFELILVDDGSIDTSSIICDSYLYDERVRVVHQSNQGVSAARNNGMQLANGTWIMFVDSDDYIESSMLSKMYESTLISPSIDLVICGYHKMIWEDRQLYNRDICAHDSIIFYKKLEFVPKILEYLDVLSAPWCKFFKLNVLRQYNVRFPLDIKYGEDVLFVFNYLYYVREVNIIKDALYYYNITSKASLSSTFFENKLAVCMHIHDFMRSFFCFYGIDNSYEIKNMSRNDYIRYFISAYSDINVSHVKRKKLMIDVNSKDAIRDIFLHEKKLSKLHKLICIFIQSNWFCAEDIFFRIVSTLYQQRWLYLRIKSLLKSCK